MSDQCDHVVIGGYCSICQEMVISSTDGSQFDYNQREIKVEKSIVNELIKYGFDEDLSKIAQEIYVLIGQPIHRTSKRKEMLVFCIGSAMEEEGMTVNKANLAEIFQMPLSDVKRSFKVYAEAKTGYRPRIKNKSDKRIGFIIEYASMMNFEQETIDSVIKLANVIISSPKLKPDSSMKIAAGILAYYMKINGFQNYKEILKNVTKISIVTISNILKVVEEIHNS